MAKRHRRGWSLWWGRGRSAPPPDVASTSSLPTEETSSVATPPTSVPASPRSLPEDAISPPVAPVADDDFPAEDNTKHYAKTLRLTSDQLVSLSECNSLSELALMLGPCSSRKRSVLRKA